MSYKSKPEQISTSEGTMAGMILYELSEYFGDYEVSFQFWGPGINSVVIDKDGVNLFVESGIESPFYAMVAARDYLDKINNNKREYNPNF